MKPEDEKTQTEKLEEEIVALQTRIKNTEYDLAHMFKGNEIIEQKLKNTKELLKEKQELLAKLNPEQLKKLRKIESKIEEKNVTSLTKEEKDFIEAEIESEFL
ncbi:MAG: hypothetical protein QW727_02815 [Candidatus Pacearchaeota archaeon]